MSSQSRGVSHLEEALPLNALQEAMEDFIDLERLIHNNVQVTLVVYTSKRFSVQLILNIIALRLSRRQPRNDTFICIETHEGP